MTNLVSAFIAWPAALAMTMAMAETQPGRPRADVTPVVTSVGPEGEALVVLHVRLPADVHVQASKPRDPSLIPTALMVEAPPGVTVEAITYPAPTELAQAGRAEPLSVLGPEFEIGVRLSIADGTKGALVVPAKLRYQACNDTVCFPPASATTEWRLGTTP
jgi:hypothetical protein